MPEKIHPQDPWQRDSISQSQKTPGQVNQPHGGEALTQSNIPPHRRRTAVEEQTNAQFQAQKDQRVIQDELVTEDPELAEPADRDVQTTEDAQLSHDQDSINLPSRDVFGRTLATFPIRLAAILIDLVILEVVGSVILFVLIGSSTSYSFNPDNGKLLLHTKYPTSFWIALAIVLLVQLAYFTFLNGSPKGQTLGKILLRISVRDITTGESIGHPRALLRIVLMFLFFITYFVPLLIDSLWVFMDPMKRTWHDLASRSIVVRV